MPNTIRILLPIFPYGLKELYFKGRVCVSDDFTITIYITKYTTKNELTSNKLLKRDNVIYGYCGNYLPKEVGNRLYNFLVIENNSLLKISQLVINGNSIGTTSDCVLMLYDYDSIKNSQAICDTTDDFLTKLVHIIQNEHGLSSRMEHKTEFGNSQWLASSMFLQHIYNYWKLINWLFSTNTKSKQISLKQGNLMWALVIDVLLGYSVLHLLSQDKKEISAMVMGILEKLINSLYSLLKWLMGAPVGLKLNNAFNKMLGNYFSYHVQLWWLFLDVSGEKLDAVLHIFHYIGYVGFTFQTAFVSDLICIATFHSYCIYVYAARLFNIQVSGLIALVRLFVGRKYNPLRGGIDSCEYTNQELFVGTVAFTILLLLLPTTALYYITFTTFRVLSLIVQYLLAKLIYMVQTLPLYVVSLWLMDSPKVKGNILVEVINQDINSPLILRIKLFNKSIPQLVDLFQPPVEVPKQVEWTNLLSNVLVGKQIV